MTRKPRKSPDPANRNGGAKRVTYRREQPVIVRNAPLKDASLPREIATATEDKKRYWESA